MDKSLKIAIVAALAITAVPAPAQQSASFTFLKAVRERDGAKATEMTSSPASHVLVNAEEPGTGNTAIHLVARDRDLTWLSFLISKGARIDEQPADGQTALGIVSQLGWIEGAELLLSQRAKVNIANNRGETPLIFAVQRRDLPMVRLLLARGADPKHTDNVAGYSALDYARQDRRADAILKMLEARAAAPVKEAAGPKL